MRVITFQRPREGQFPSGGQHQRYVACMCEFSAAHDMEGSVALSLSV